MGKIRAVLTRGRLPTLPRKGLNFLVNRRERRRDATTLKSRPYGADIVTTRRCNLNCVMCIKYPSKPPASMPMDVFDRVAADLFPHLIYVRFCSGGEHLMHPHFREMLARCKAAGCVVTLMSNGMLMGRDWAEFIVAESSIWSIGFSMDAATPGTLESIRQGANFGNVVANIRGLEETKARHRSRFPLTALRATLMRRNIEELPHLVRLAHEWGVGTVHAGYLITPPHLPADESLWHHRDLVPPVFEEARRYAQELGVTLNLPGLIEKRPRCQQLCVLPWTQVYVDPNGDVRLCCNAWDDEGVLGNMVETPFEQVWNCERYVQIRQSLLDGRPAYKRCINCAALAENPGELATHFLDPTKSER